MRLRRVTLRGRRAFTVIELMVALAIMAILAAAIAPAVLGRIRESRQSALSQTMFALSQGIAEYRKAVTRYPRQLTLLTTRPVLGVGLDACGNPLNQSNINNWRGPYVSRQMLSSGLPMGEALILNDLSRVTSGTAAFLLIRATSVDREIATRMEAELDGAVIDSVGGTIRFSATNARLVTLDYAIPIAGC